MKSLSIVSILIAIFIGIFGAETNQISAITFTTNGLGFLAGAALIVCSPLWGKILFKNISVSIAIVLILLVLTFFSVGYDHVKRWIFVGPVSIHVSIMLAPILIVGFVELKQRFVFLVSFILSAIYFFQPDASQATALFFTVTSIVCLRKDFEMSSKAFVISVLALTTIATWFKKDPLLPVPQVEQILHLVPVYISILALGILFFPLFLILYKSSDRQERILVGGQIIYWMTSFIVTEFGYFPVPVIGAGAAGVLGFSLSYVVIFSKPQ